MRTRYWLIDITGVKVRAEDMDDPSDMDEAYHLALNQVCDYHQSGGELDEDCAIQAEPFEGDA